MNVSHLWFASINQMEVRGVVSLRLHIGQPHEKVRLLVVPGMATNMLLGIAFISRYIKKISSKAETISSVKSSPVAITGAAEGSLSMAVESDEQRESAEPQGVIARSVTISPMGETFVQIKLSARRIDLVEHHNNLAGRHQALGAQGIVDAFPAIPFNVKVASLPNSYCHLPKVMKVAKCSPVPPM